MWACRDLRRINTSAVLRTYGICHLPLGKRLSLGSAAAPPPQLSHHISLYPTFPSSLSSCRDLKAWSALVVYCALNVPFVHPSSPPPALPPNFAVLREKWLSGGEGADAVKPSRREAGVITGRCSCLILCEEVKRAGVEKKVTPATGKLGRIVLLLWHKNNKASMRFINSNFFSFVSVPANCCLTHLMSSFYS